MLLALSRAWQKREHRRVEPFAQLLAMYANAHRKKGTPAFKPDDFYPPPGGRAVTRRSREELRKRIRVVRDHVHQLGERRSA